ncbi:meiosis regulator and mRNA stability factor 1 [Tribolium madens]|uniref:meiosis regulator and mRNA stability factor 1 n=1 Tax=Tribolium madens TaxID=41895 RepID=UPI001CF71DA2|nr:meiosis regulator and mRNA stability factor 1 [Tribolium madens]
MHSSGTNSQDSSDDSHRKFNLSDYTTTRAKFRFPPKPRLSKSVNNSYVSSQSDSSTSAQNFRKPHKRKPQSSHRLPPLGIFWDIENCHVPKNTSASAVVQRIREFFLEKNREAEFLVVCDVKKERPQVIQELHDSQVTLIHVASTSKNAADEKLRQSLRRFAEVFAAPSAVVLISGDINFAADLSDLRYRKKIRVILVHNTNVADALILCANEHYSYRTITEGLPKEKPKGVTKESSFLQISNLPTKISASTIKNRLNFLSNNCGGRVVEVQHDEGVAYIRFSNQDFANRAQKRIHGEDVFGNKIKAVTPTLRSYTGRKVKDGVFQGAQGRDKKFYEQEFPPIRPMASSSSLMDTNYLNRRLRTPQETLPSRVRRTSVSSEYSDDGGNKMQIDCSKPVDLIISNLDPALNIKELRRMLTDLLKEYAMISSLKVMVQSDGIPVANIRVNNQQAAQFIISQLHRQKLGHKRIAVSYAQSNSPNLEELRAMVISVIQEVPDNNMPLFKFMELLESRYNYAVSVSEVNKLKDICKISDNLGCRIISFPQQMKVFPPPNLSKTLVPYCTIHCAGGLPNLGWCELNTNQNPNIMMSLRQFTTKLDQLLNLHMGSMPLLSFQACYEQVCHETLPVDASGVPLEHLISCVANIEIKNSGPNKNIKVIKRELKVEMDEETILKAVPPSLVPNISLLCREVVDLLKTTDRCQLLLSKFIPAYHRHFGRQCHVADYGYVKLIDLFESISHVVQIIGDGSRKIITLSHQAQMRRFTSDLLRVLKVQPTKQITVGDFPAAYERVMNRVFNPVDYGLCTFLDLLDEVPDNVVVIMHNDENLVISVPKREQTAKQLMKTKQFAMEVIDILRHSPNCTMLFTKFVPAYHHHFGYQCRVSDYGFTKLIDLFEAIPDVVKIQELVEGERTISLTLNQSLKILGTQIVSFVKNSPTLSILLEELPGIYLKECGYPLKPQVYESETLFELLEKLNDYVQVVDTSSGHLVVTVDVGFIAVAKIRIWAILVKPPYRKEFSNFKYEYQWKYNSDININDLKQLRNVVTLSVENDGIYIALTDLYVIAAELYHILYIIGGSILFDNLRRLYYEFFGKNIRLSDFKINTIDQLYEQFDFLFFICGYNKSVLALNRNLGEYHVPIPRQIYDWNHQTKKSPPPPIPKSSGAIRKFKAPKPDTPPTPTSFIWSPLKNSALESEMNLAIDLPIIQNPQPIGNPYDLISPAKLLFSRNQNPWGKAPDPAELPMPDKLMLKGVYDDSTDSGVNSKLENSPSDNETESGACGSGTKRRFTSYLDFDN